MDDFEQYVSCLPSVPLPRLSVGDTFTDRCCGNEWRTGRPRVLTVTRRRWWHGGAWCYEREGGVTLEMDVRPVRDWIMLGDSK